MTDDVVQRRSLAISLGWTKVDGDELRLMGNAPGEIGKLKREIPSLEELLKGKRP